MKTLQIEENEARKLYKNSSSEFKTVLENTFGKDFFSGKITDRIKTYEDACEELQEKPLNEKELRNLGFSNDEIDYKKIKTITRALNEEFVADFTNHDQKKWYPWFKVSSSGVFACHAANYGYSNAIAGYGARLCFSSDELATYAGKQFTELYKSFIL